MDKLGLSASELARRVGVTQGAISKIAANNPNGSTHLHSIAQHLRTTPAYLTGQIDDPDEGVPPPPPPMPAMLMMQVALPSEEALAEMFAAILSVSRDMTEDELALELARMLPKGLEIAQRVQPTYRRAFPAEDAKPADIADDDGPPRRRASGR